jgi:hypothetical protein
VHSEQTPEVGQDPRYFFRLGFPKQAVELVCVSIGFIELPPVFIQDLKIDFYGLAESIIASATSLDKSPQGKTHKPLASVRDVYLSVIGKRAEEGFNAAIVVLVG